jgi:Fe-Mn family superoxide dismutase
MKSIMLIAVFLGALFTTQAQNESKVKVQHEMAPLPYTYDALEKAIDKETMEIHYDKHYRGYYNKFLKAIEGTDLEYMSMEEIFANMDKYPDAVRNNAGGYYNHAMFWTIMSPNGGIEPANLKSITAGNFDHDKFWDKKSPEEITKITDHLAKAIDKSFGSFDEFKKQFAAAGSSRFGSGWAWLNVDKKGNLFISSTANQNNPLMNDSEQQGTPILCMDVWEHAYYLRYQNKRGSYIDNFFSVIDWAEVAKRYQNAVSC